MSQELSIDFIKTRIFVIRGRKVMLDKDLAELYGVVTSQLTRQVRRNIGRFPHDFMILLTHEEFNNLICQIGTSSWGGTRKMPLAFTEQGIAMLSGVLNSKRAIQVNIAIMRAFVQIREMLLTHKELASKIETLELKYKNHDMKLADHDAHIAAIFEAIKQLVMPLSEPDKRRIGFK
jgi:hypothetical protein